MMAHIFPSVLLSCLDKLLFDLWQAFNSSFKIMPSTHDRSLSALRSLSSLLLPHKAPQNLFWSCSSFRALLVSRSNSVMAILTSLSSSYYFWTLMAVELNFFLTAWALSSSAFRVCNSSLYSRVSTSSFLVAFSLGSQSNSCVQTLNHLR